MPNTLQITNELAVTLLIDIHNMVFARHYRDGPCWSLSDDYQGEKPLLDIHLVANLKRDAAKGYFDGQHEDSLLYVGFYFGVLHGCLLSPQTGQLRPDVTAVVTSSHPDAAKDITSDAVIASWICHPMSASIRTADFWKNSARLLRM